MRGIKPFDLDAFKAGEVAVNSFGASVVYVPDDRFKCIGTLLTFQLNEKEANRYWGMSGAKV